jgi:hypothetical protein
MYEIEEYPTIKFFPAVNRRDVEIVTDERKGRLYKGNYLVINFDGEKVLSKLD